MSDRTSTSLTMRQPAEWQVLLAMAGDLVQNNLLDNEARLTQLCTTMGEMGNNELANNRYYAIGLTACEFARIAMQPDERQNIIDRRVSHIVSNHRDYCYNRAYRPSDGLYLHELGLNPNRQDPQAEAAANCLQPAVRLLGEALTGVEVVRGLDKEYRRKSIKPDGRSPVARAVAEALEMKGLARSIGQYLGSASALSILALENIYRMRRGLPIPNSREERLQQPVNPLVADVGLEVLADPAILRLAVDMAVVRLDELQEDMEEFVIVDKQGVTHFDRASIPKIPSPPGEPAPNAIWTMHEQRIGCPALYVRGLIQLVMGMIPEIAQGAQRKVAIDFPR